ncbi:hypothetical protein E2C01_092060 [Portunus trituberculatus]|uniref:Uncharacterized protein n=1 Tax=Portunus trituberculatus TaxID=210409 RepID=A0A5B7JKL1_PORTR|nr:hypothetical protein [Portunus trituberculatus]
MLTTTTGLRTGRLARHYHWTEDRPPKKTLVLHAVSSPWLNAESDIPRVWWFSQLSSWCELMTSTIVLSPKY